MNALVHELSGAVRKSDVGQRLTDSIPGRKPVLVETLPSYP